MSGAGAGAGLEESLPAGPDVVVDARALRCPLPIVELAKTARSLDPGSVVEVWWTDPAAEHDIPAWARMRGHTVVAAGPHPTDPAAGVTTVRIGAAGAPGAPGAPGTGVAAPRA